MDLIHVTAQIIALAQRPHGVTVGEVMDECSIRDRWAREILYRLRRGEFVTSQRDSARRDGKGGRVFVFFWRTRPSSWA